MAGNKSDAAVRRLIFYFSKEEFYNSTIHPLPDDKFLDSSKLIEFADDHFRFHKNGRKLSKKVENTVGKGEIALYEQFSPFPTVFSNGLFPGASKGVIVWEWA